ncbi:MAG: hypothetical protein IPH13_12970 [Planctomycetes bacterium]|nr:hypothetical protein [Planctomycetota bacterium]MCC7170632.1 hypothetical protein [Planctomycetota bacterium]
MSRFGPIAIGVDAGGTKTRIAVLEGRRRLASQIERGINAATVGANAAANSLVHAIGQACAAAACPIEGITEVAVGIAGAGTPAIQRALSEALERAFDPARVFVTSDAEAALAGVGSEPRGGPRALVIAGTGSIALARDREGATARAGGHGFLLGDEGSAAWIAREAVRMARRSQDGRAEPTALAERFAGRVSPTDAAGFASLFPLVVECAEGGDKIALALFKSAADELARAALAALRALDLTSTPLPLGITGGALSSSTILRTEFTAALRTVAPAAFTTELEVPPEIAVLHLLRTADGITS